MQITVPTFTHTPQGASSVLELEPFLHFARQCRPDAASVLPPVGPDDQPNGAALLAMKGRLEAEGLAVHGGTLTVAREAPVLSPAWQTQNLFEARALVAALGEAGVDPLVLEWHPPLEEPMFRDALTAFLERLLEEAERGKVRVALQAPVAAKVLAGLLQPLRSKWLGACWRPVLSATPAGELEREVEALRSRLLVAVLDAGNSSGEAEPLGWAQALRVLSEEAFSEVLLLEGCSAPVACAHAVGLARGLLAALA